MTIRLSKRSVLTYAPLALRDTGKYRQLAPDAWAFLSCLDDEDASHVALATEDGKIVGWFRFTVYRKTLFAQGTWVEKGHRRQGIAKSLWAYALRRLRPQTIEVAAVSGGGKALIKGLRRDFPGIKEDK